MLFLCYMSILKEQKEPGVTMLFHMYAPFPRSFFFSYVRAEIENRWGMTNAKSSLLHSPPPLRGPRAKRQRQDLGYLASSVSVPYFVVQKENRQVIDETGVAQRGILDVHAHV